MFKEFYYWNILLFKQSKTNDSPAFNASLVISCLQIANIITILGLLGGLPSIKIGKSADIIIGIVLSLTVIIFNFFFLFQSREVIINKYDKLGSGRRNLGKFFFVLYIILTVAAFIVSRDIVLAHQ